MDVRRDLARLVLLTCVVGILSSSDNDHRAIVSNPVIRNRRYALSEFLIPPPLPQSQTRVYSGGRTGRTSNNPRPVESPGYFSKFISWFNPFGSGTSAETPLPPPPPPSPPQPPTETLHPPKFLQSHVQSLPPSVPPPVFPLATSQVYNAPVPPVFDRPPLPQPPTPLDVYNKFKSQQVKGKNCNPCNKVPWLPMNYQGTYLPPVGNQNGHQRGIPDGDYLPPYNQGLIAAASHEVKVPDFFYAPPLPPGHNGENPMIGPLPNPHLYPGPMPPLFKAELFDYDSQSSYTENGNLQHSEIPVTGVLETSSSLPITNNYQINDSGDRNLGIPQEGQTIFESHQVSDSRLSQTGYNNQGYSNSNSQTGGVQIDSFSSASQDNQHGSVVYPSVNRENNGQSIKQHFEDPGIHQFSGPNNSGNLEHTNFDNNQRFMDHSGLDFQRTDQTVPPTVIGNDHYGFGITGSGQQTYNDDISSNIGTVKDSHASGTDGFSNVQNPIYFEQSPLTDLTKTGESRTDSPTISSSSSFVDIDEKYNTQTPLDYESNSNSFQGKQTIHRFPSSGGSNNSFHAYPTESTVIKDLFGINQINEQKWTNSKTSTLINKGLQNLDGSFVGPKSQSADSWLVVLSTTMRTIQDETLLNDLGNNRDTDRGNHNLQQQYGGKRNKQVQVIIPYTSQYTPLPFHSSYDNKNNVNPSQSRTISFEEASNRDNYVSQESRNENKVINRQESATVSGDFNTVDDTSITRLETTTQPISNIAMKRVNNSIDVHRLQKNIDNWTIQEYSRGTTFSTILPSSSRPYLKPSKIIPNEYFTTTESGDRANDRDENNVKSFALAGFSFNDIEDEGPNPFEESRIQTIHVENPTIREESNSSNAKENNLNVTAKRSESSWKGFPVLISTVDKERVYVVTPQTTATTISIEHDTIGNENKSSVNNTQKERVVNSKNNKNEKQDEFEKIERAYQVLPQAVNNLAVASTGPETLPLWGIMEHEEFASLVHNEDDNSEDESVVAPILYAGHSKVSRARR